MQFLRNVREYWTPVLTESAFLERGVLTPEEFVRSCDNFISCFPMWKWAKGNPNGMCPYLPKEKQFLEIKGVPCHYRASKNNKMIILENSVENDWQDSTIEGHERNDATYDLENLEDLDDFCNGEIIKCRRYNISITYDKYYQTPKCWLTGVNEDGNPLTPEEMFMDIVDDYANKTATIEMHPHLFTSHVYIHPCKHATVMKNMMKSIVEHGGTPTVEQYMILFIKFIQNVIPTIEYDYTSDAVLFRNK